MSFLIMCVLIALCLVRIIYVGFRDKNYGVALGSIVLLAWAVYRVLSYGGLLPEDLVIERTDYFPKM